jgi:carbon-monoxide dehydrogenase medium subunit
LAGIKESSGGLAIGGTTTHREVETSPLVAQRFPVLEETMRKVATIRIRNMGTLGGNIAHGDPALDPPVTLIALDARARLVSKAGERVVPLDEFFLDYYETVVQPGEIVAEILVPAMPARSDATFIKFLPRTADDYATVGVTTRLTLDQSGKQVENVRIALGSSGSTTIRAREAEKALIGQPATEESFRAAAAVAKTEVDPISDIRGSSEYKTDMAEVFVRRALVQTLDKLQGAGSGNGMA